MVCENIRINKYFFKSVFYKEIYTFKAAVASPKNKNLLEKYI